MNTALIFWVLFHQGKSTRNIFFDVLRGKIGGWRFAGPFIIEERDYFFL